MNDEATIHVRMLHAQKAIGAIAKEGAVVVSGRTRYNFRGIDQVMNAFHPVLSEAGIHMTTTIVSRDEPGLVTTANERISRTHGITLRVTFWAPDGSHVESEAYAEAWDSGDKASNKAMSTALRYILLQTFCVPTEGAQTEHESENFEIADQRDPSLMSQEQFDELKKLGARGKDMYGHEWDRVKESTLKDLDLSWSKGSGDDATAAIAKLTAVLEEEAF